MSRLTKAGVTAGVALTLACASLNGPATATSPSPTAAIKATSISQGDASPDKKFNPASRAAAMKVAQGKASSIAKSLGLTSAQKLHTTDVERDADGTLHLRYSRTLGGLPVMGGDFVVHQSPSGKIQSTDFASDQPLVLDTTAATKVSAVRGAQLASKAVGVSSAKAGTAKKVVWAVSGIPRLAWMTEVNARDARGNFVPQAVVVDARTGATIQKWNLHQDLQGKGKSLYSGTVKITTVKKNGKYLLKDPSRGNSVFVNLNGSGENPPGQPPFANGPIFKDNDNVWGNGRPNNTQSAAVDVAYGSAKTWDFFKQSFNRRGIANDGKGAKSRVHFGVGYDNAFWSDACFCMTYGDGGTFFKPLVELDVAGHEMTHGVTSNTAGLYYFGDQGGLNESTSDIFGTLVEFFAKNEKDKGDYYIGEKIAIPATLGTPYLRRMDNPQLDGNSFNCWSIQMGYQDPHFTSGPGNHFFYMLAEGSGAKTIGGRQHNSPTCGGAPAVQGIGKAKAGQIWYRALTRYFVSTTNYIDARDNTIRAAIDLYGKNSGACKQVVKAWNAVAVPKQYWTCKGGLKEGPNTFGLSPGFEQNRAAWTTAGGSSISNNGASGLPRSGQWFGLYLEQGAANNGTWSHEITVPDTLTAKLRFYMLLSAATNGTVNVTFDGSPIDDGTGTFTQDVGNNSFIRWDVTMSEFAGDTGTLTLTVNSNAGGYFQVLLDDFTLTPR